MMKKIYNVIMRILRTIWNYMNNAANVVALVIAVISLLISWDAFKVSELALKVSTKDTEPIIEMSINYNDETIEIENNSYEYYQITNVNYGKIRFIGVFNNNNEMSYVYLPEDYTTMTLEHGHTVGTDMSDAEISKYNKKMRLSLNKDNSLWSQTDNIDLIENTIINMCEAKQCTYWDVSPNYCYYYIEINFKDSYGNRDSLYYIYKCEYGSTWQIYKVDSEEYINYMSEVYKDINNDNVIVTIFSNENFKSIDNTKYKNFYYDVNYPVYQKVGKDK